MENNKKVLEFFSQTKKTKEVDMEQLDELQQYIENLEIKNNIEKIIFLNEINKGFWDFRYYELRGKQSKMSSDGRYEREKTMKKFEVFLGIENSEIKNYENLEIINEKLKILNIQGEISKNEVTLLYNIINSFYSRIMAKFTTDLYYAWVKYKNELNKNETKKTAEKNYEESKLKYRKEIEKEVSKFEDLLFSKF